jgi:hypothetical protein
MSMGLAKVLAAELLVVATLLTGASGTKALKSLGETKPSRVPASWS